MDGIKRLVYGIYPRSDSLRIQISRWERKKVGTEDLRVEIRKEKEEIIEAFRTSSEFYTDPAVNWHDLFRPVVGLLDGISFGRLERYIETNTFYRQPVINALPTLRADFHEQAVEENLPPPVFQEDANSWLLLPSPYSFYRASQDVAGIGFDKFSEAVFSAYEEIAGTNGKSSIVLREIFPYDDSIPSSLGNLNGKFNVILVTQGGIRKPAPGKFAGKFYSVVVPEEELGFVGEYSGIPGIPIIDAKNTRLENTEQLRNRIEETRENIGERELLITTNHHLDFLPRIIADRKLGILKSLGGQ